MKKVLFLAVLIFMILLWFDIRMPWQKKEVSLAKIHTNKIALKNKPSANNWCGESILLELTRNTDADTVDRSSNYASSHWIWLGAQLNPRTLDLKIGIVYEVSYQILGTCRGTVYGEHPNTRMILVRILSYKQIGSDQETNKPN